MSSDQPNATWHPALMPHAAEKPDKTAGSEAAAKPAPADLAPAPVDTVADAAVDDTAVDAWFPEYDAGSSWAEPKDASTDAVGPVEPTENAETVVTSETVETAETETAETGEHTEEHSEQPEPSQPDAPVASPADPPTDTVSKHSSTLSFARTVSNDVNWDADGDDDGAEWSLPRSDTDPFRFLPPSDRTNSFPVVPPAAPEADNQADEPTHGPVDEPAAEPAATPTVAPAAALDAEQTDAAVAAWDLDADEEDASFFASAGDAADAADAADAEQEEPAEVPDARYEEGVPLIPHGESTAADTPTQEHAPKDLFTETDTEEDDFFSGAAATSTTADSAPAPPAFERKSTMQVLNAMNVGNLARSDSRLEATPEAGEATQETEPSEESEAKANGGGDLAAKWAAVLDDEDELLLDDTDTTPEATQETTETKEIDPAAFFVDDDEGFLDDEPDVPASQPSAPEQPASSRYLPQPAQAQAQQQSLPLQQPASPYLPTPAYAGAAPAVPNPFPVSYGGYAAPAAAPVPALQQLQQQGEPQHTLRKAQSFVDKSKGGYQSPYDLPMDVVKPPRKRQSMQQLPRAADPIAAPPPPPRSSSVQTFPSPTTSVFTPGPPPPPSAPVAASTPPQPLVRQGSFFEDLPMVPKVRPVSRRSQPSPPQPTPYAVPPPPPPSQAQPSPYTPAPTQTPSVPPPPPPSAAYYAPHPAGPPAPSPAAALPTATAPPPPPAPGPSAGIAGLVAPPRVSPYAPLPSGSSSLGTPPIPGAPRYSPSPSQPQAPAAAAGALQASRYSPAPPPRVPSGGYAPATAGAGAGAILPHQPRTSSPLAHFEMSYDKPRAASLGVPPSHGDGHTSTADRRSSSFVLESRLNRVPSLPPTREEDEEPSLLLRPTSSGASQTSQTSQPGQPGLTGQTGQAGQYSPQKARQTPPPPPANAYGQMTMSPPKRVLSYAPHGESQQQPQQPYSHSPPRRSQTQSPGALYGSRTAARHVDPIPRPSSVHDVAPVASPAVTTRPRAPSQNLNLVPPTDGSETDPLQRWRGAPSFAWGVGGTFVSSFPQDLPRYGMNQAMPMIHRTAGEVHVKNIKELQPLDERLAKFPGPLKGKSKKKEVLAWLTAGIEGLERSLPQQSAFSPQPSHDDKRLEERILLWKILRLFIEHDGVLEGTPAVDKAVREVLSPYTAEELASSSADTSTAAMYAGFPGASLAQRAQVQADSVDPSVVDQIRKDLLLGDKEKAVWNAVDKRLWGHAFLVAGAASRELFKKVAQEFVRKEVNTPGVSHNESLAALYEVLSGNHEECVDELVPVHARAGLQLIATTAGTTPHNPAHPTAATGDGLAGLDKWRETLCLVLSNRSVDDVQAINSLGRLLAGYGRAEAAHVCFLFARGVTVFGGLDDPATNMVLLGADHQRQADSFAKETDAVLLSEVYEYGLSLAAGGSGSGGSSLAAATGGASPHLAAYKLQHALTLAEFGLRDKALQYCDALVAAMNAQTRRSPYYHPLLEAAVEDLAKRLKQAPREESNSWISKPSMNKVSDTVWNRFNKFVAGDDSEGVGSGPDSDAHAETGPFARIASGTPTISRPPSSSGGGGVGAGGDFGLGLTGMEMFGGALKTSASSSNIPGPVYGVFNGSAGVPPPTSVPMPATRAGSRYAPGAAGQGMPAIPAAANPYEPSAAAAAAAAVSARPTSSSAYTAPPSRHVSGEQPTGVASEAYLVPRPPSGLSVGYSPYAPQGNGAAGAEAQPGSRSLSRKSSYTPLHQVESVPAFNPYAPAPSNDSNPVPNGSPYAPYAPATTTPPPEEKTDSSNGPEYGGYQPVSYGYEPPSTSTFEPASGEAASSEPADDAEGGHANGNTKADDSNGYFGYEPPSFQPYSYEPPSYEGDDGPDDESGAAAPKKKPSILDDDEDDIPALKKPAEKTREEKERENMEMVRRVAEEEAKRAAAEKEAKAKKGWGLTSWFGGKKETADGGGEAPKAVRANLGEKNNFYYDPELKRWINKKAGPDDQTGKATPPPPPPRSASQSGKSTPSASPSLSSAALGGGGGSASAPPLPPMSTGGASAPAPTSMGPPGLPPTMSRTASSTSAAGRPPSRPTTGVSETDSIDELLGGAMPGPRKAGAKKGRKGGRYVDVMAK